MENADIENGAMFIYPGSHVEPLLPFEERASYLESRDDKAGYTLEVPDEYKDRKTDLIVGKGSLLVMHGHCIHGSYENISESRARPLLSCSYISEGEPFVSGTHSFRAPIPLHRK